MLGSTSLKNNINTANTIKMTPVISAEWNQNLFNPPYTTISSSGIVKTLDTPSVEPIESPITKNGFVTKKIIATAGLANITYPIISSTDAYAYKIITYVRTNNLFPVIVNTYAKTGATLNDAYGSNSVDATSFSWTKVETVIGSLNSFAEFEYTISAHNKDASIEPFDLYFTEPEVYEITKFDYLNHSLWPTDAPFTYFRPGESYIGSGNENISFPANYRRVAIRDDQKMPATPIIYAPRTATLKAPINNFVKHGMLSDINPYKYFVSDATDKTITALWKPTINANKIILKFQTLISSPVVEISIGTSSQILTIDDETGVAVLYWNGNSWTTNKWAVMPTIESNGNVSLYQSIDKITVTQISSTIKDEFSSITGSDDFTTDFSRMHLIEISPRLEVDLSNFVQNVSINKSLDNGSTGIPIASIDSNDGSVTFSSIPFTDPETGDPLPIFSNENNSTLNVLSNLLRKNVKFNIGFNVEYTAGITGVSIENEYIQSGVFFADSWREEDVTTVSVQMFDVTRYLQNTPVPDYISKFRPVIEIISDIFDFAGFTDYDYNSLYEVCNNPFSPVDIAYYFCNSKDKTVFDAIREIFLAYQIGAYIDEWGIIQFTTLTKILQNSTNVVLDIDDSNIVEDSFSLETSSKPGKISVRYQSPKILQSASIQNIQDSSIINSPSFVLTTSNDVVWQQQSADSSGFNYLKESMGKDDDSFTIEIADLLDIFHTYSVDFNGFAVIEDEIVSFEFKEYIISGRDINDVVVQDVVSIINNIELQAKINDFIKNNKIFREDVTVTPTGNIVNVKRGLFGTQVRDHDIIFEDIDSKNLLEGTISTGGVVTQTTSGTYAKVSPGTLFYNKNRIVVG